MVFAHSAAWKNSETDLMVNFSHAYLHRGGNCNCLLSHTARWFPIANNLQEFFVHAAWNPDSWPRRSSQNFQFCSQNSYFEFPARYFSSPQFSICDNQVLTSSDESPGRKIPIRSWDLSDSRILNLYNPSEMSSGGIFSSLTIKFRLTLSRIPEHCHFEEKHWIGRHSSRQNRWLLWPGSTHRSSKQSVFREKNGPASGPFVPPNWFLLLSKELWMILFSAEGILASSTSKISHWNTSHWWRRL